MDTEEKGIISLIFCIIFKVSLISYFIYHIVFNDYGIFNYRKFYEVYGNKKLELKKTEQEFNRKQNKVKRLQVNNLDLDLFDEEIRKNLGIVGENEIVLFTNDIKAE